MKWMKPGEFADIMQRELDANRNKGNWAAWQPSASVLVSELMQHVGKLCYALATADKARVTEHAADTANCCLKAVERFGER